MFFSDSKIGYYQVMDSDAEGVPSEFFDYFKVSMMFSFGTPPFNL